MLTLFACDLDNTLIHSYKHRTPDDICIELYQGREQSFISRRTVELLRDIFQKLLFIPVTTRSIEQYNRIKWLEGTSPEYAVVSNGANLLHNGKVDVEWQAETLKYIQPYNEELQRQCVWLSQREEYVICRIVDDSFLFLKCNDNVDIDSIVSNLKDNTTLNVQHTGRKIYLFPPTLNKGEALTRLKRKFNPGLTISAGDSTIDIPMLSLADTAYVP